MEPTVGRAQTWQAPGLGCSQQETTTYKRELQDCHKHLLMASLKTA